VESSGFLPPAAPAPAGTPAPAGYAHSFGITFSPHVIAWLPAVLLTVVLVCTFFPWVGCYAGGSAVYSQRPWGAMFGHVSRNFALESIISGQWLDRTQTDWKVMVPFFLALFVTLSFAWAERGARSVDPRKIPPLAKLWPWRNAIVAGGAGLILLLLVIQWMNGFGMERAIREHIGEQFTAQREKAANSPAEQKKLEEFTESQALLAFGVEHTTWMYLALACSALAVLAVMIRAGLEARGNKPPPKLLFHY
jgi:hypothetical protein